MNNNGCLSRELPSDIFKEEFLNHRLLKILPSGYEICYIYKEINDLDDSKNITFYLYDSSSPLLNYDFNLVIGSINIYIDNEEIDDDDETSANFTISNLDTNDKLEEFNLRRSGIGTYLLLIGILYASTLDYETIALDDMASFSDGFPIDNNIYTKVGFKYVNEGEPEMIGDVDNMINNIEIFLNSKMKSMINRLEELTDYFDDEEWEYVTDSDSDYDSDYMSTD
jgi:hypothetical protein